jgi:glycerol transport system ATP-binding protein
MYEGEIVQIGTPGGAFENPRHKFVGYFIGSPGMNFLPCTIEGQNARVDGVTIALEPETAARGPGPGGAGTGHPPHAYRGARSAVDGGVPVTMKTVEDQGSFKILTTALNGHTVIARVPEGHRFRKIRHG